MTDDKGQQGWTFNNDASQPPQGPPPVQPPVPPAQPPQSPPPGQPPAQPPQEPTPSPNTGSIFDVASPSPPGTYPSVPDYAAAAVKKPMSSTKKIIIGVIAIIGLLGMISVAAFAYGALTGNSAGAASPEGVLTNYVSAIENQDLLKAIRQNDPHEVEPLIENYDLFMKELKDNDDIKNEKKPLEGYEFEAQDLETKTVMYSDDVARVELLGGKITYQGVDDEESTTDNIDDANKAWRSGEYYFWDSENFNKDDLESKNIFYIAVRRDGRWFMSSLYTLAEYLRIAGNANGGDYKRPSFEASERFGNGGSTPEEATEVFIEELFGLNAEDTIRATAPNRFSIAHDYIELIKKVDGRNANNPYVLAARDAVDVTDLNTTQDKDGNNRQFVTINSVKVKVDYELDLDQSQLEQFEFVPYAAKVDASFDGQCYSYKGSYSTYEGVTQYFPTVTFPIADAEGQSYIRDDFERTYPNVFDLEFPVTDAAGRIFPDRDSLLESATYFPVPWTDSNGQVVYDGQGNEVTDYFDVENPVVDATGNEVVDSDGSFVGYDDLKVDYQSVKTKLNEKDCLDDDFPTIGFSTIQEEDEYFVSPIDTIWHYVVEYVKND